MTFEHNLVVGLEEIKAIVFECATCHSRTVFLPDADFSIPTKCASGHLWDSAGGAKLEDYQSMDTPLRTLISSLKKLRHPSYEQISGFKILLQFDARLLPSSPPPISN
jgi:hypothetical protein